MPWDPVQYQVYSHYRLRPALDLIHRIPLQRPARIVDLGCGVGDITRQLKVRWPEAKIIGVDSSAEKLERARQTSPDIEWQLADLDEWSPNKFVDLIFSHSALGECLQHEILLPKLASWIAPNGVFALQMPSNSLEPSHTLICQLASQLPWSKYLADLALPAACKPAQFYWELLHSHARSLDIWETSYLHVLEGENPVASFLEDALLGKVFDRLEAEEQQAFMEAYRQGLKIAYPPNSEGKTLFPDHRLFMVAQVND